MSHQQIVDLLVGYRYWILVPLSIIEGPMVAFVSGTLASLGYFNILVLAVLFFMRDIILDSSNYMLGYFGKRSFLIKKLFKKLDVKENELDKVRTIWEKHPARTMFIGKLSYGVSVAFIILTGMIRMRFKTFIIYAGVVAVIQYGLLLSLGYFFGNRLLSSVQYIQNFIIGITVVVSLYYFLSWYLRKKHFHRYIKGH